MTYIDSTITCIGNTGTYKDDAIKRYVSIITWNDDSLTYLDKTVTCYFCTATRPTESSNNAVTTFHIAVYCNCSSPLTQHIFDTESQGLFVMICCQL